MAIKVHIGKVGYPLRMLAHGGGYGTTVKVDPRGGFIVAEVLAVHSRECIERRWGRKNWKKPCNCGADEMALALQLAGDT